MGVGATLTIAVQGGSLMQMLINDVLAYSKVDMQAITKKCVDAQGGEIVVNSQVGVGTTFTVTLPLLEA